MVYFILYLPNTISDIHLWNSHLSENDYLHHKPTVRVVLEFPITLNKKTCSKKSK